MNIQLQTIKDISGIVCRKRGDIFPYNPWNFQWQGIGEKDRVAQGLFIHCYGQGEFEVLRDGQDVKRIEAKD